MTSHYGCNSCHHQFEIESDGCTPAGTDIICPSCHSSNVVLLNETYSFLDILKGLLRPG